ncbi:MAG: hypothetical protein A3K19_03080 [Lentisphaerae bacterium RIFOXYB12_FULL_65_16]|nr:MAG: hypothetical protein A3K18_23515 [Lentisphaerae bacterium RIFOXYA12_64_32]OGV92111.1 MAG: hypothetical protein A3K19_03080 [Lentisphaerae bacterium RIFOXYB12_FULL_65_16]
MMATTTSSSIRVKQRTLSLTEFLSEVEGPKGSIRVKRWWAAPRLTWPDPVQPPTGAKDNPTDEEPVVQ